MSLKMQARTLDSSSPEAVAEKSEPRVSLASPLKATRSLTKRTAWTAALLVTDAITLIVVSALAVNLWAVPVQNQPPSLYIELLPFVVLFILAYAKGGLYPGFGLGAVQQIRRLSLWTSFLFIVLAAASFVFKLPHQYSRATFLLSWAGCLCALPIARFAVLSLVSRAYWWGEPTVIIGTGHQARRTIRSLRQSLTLGYRPRCVVSLDDQTPRRLENLPVLGGLERIGDLVSQGFQIAILAAENVENRGRIIEHLQYHFRHVLVVPHGGNFPIEGVEIRNLGGVLGIEFRNQLLRRRSRFLKRAIDISVGLVASVLSAPLVMAAAAAIRLSDKGPAFFLQERVGLDGRLIKIRKLRTMYLDAEDKLEAHLQADSEARREWERRFKLTSDPRILPVFGSLLRRFSIDELPQLWQVVSGELSLVGPRPFPKYHLRKFSVDFQTLRRRVRPGITGLWQVMIRSAGGLEEQELYDSYYIRNWSVWMDIYILARTTLAVLTGKGAH